MGAAVVDGRADAVALLDRLGATGGRALVLGGDGAGDSRTQAPTPDAERLLDRLRTSQATLTLLSGLLRETWIVEDLAQVPDEFDGVAVTRAGRVWVPALGELRQAPGIGEERVLAERNRREQLIAETERAAGAEQRARAMLDATAARVSEREQERQRAIDQAREKTAARDDAAEERRRIAKLIDRRRSGDDEGDGASRRAQLRAEIASERGMLERREHDRELRTAHLKRLRKMIESDESLRLAIAAMTKGLTTASEAIAAQRDAFDAVLTADRAVGEELAAQLRSCAHQEAELHSRLHAENESLTALEVEAQRADDQLADGEQLLAELAQRLELEATPSTEALEDEQREALLARLERLARRREQLGPVNPLAQEEYANAVEHAEELERQRSDLENALRELEKLIADTDREIRERFEQTFEAAAGNFEELSAQLFPGGRGRLRLVSERDAPARVLGGQPPPGEDEPAVEETDEEHGAGEEPEEQLGVEIEITPAGKEMKRLSLLSGGEKAMTALAFLFSVFLAKPCPFYILDEVEAALDDVNIDRFLELLRQYSKRAQFIVVTHQKRTMEAADSLYGVSMGGDGISKVISRRLPPEQAQARAAA